MLGRIINFLITFLAVVCTLIVIVLILFSDMIFAVKDKGGSVNTSAKTVTINFDTDPLVINGSDIDFMQGVTAVDEYENDVTNLVNVSVVNENNKKVLAYSINGDSYELETFKRGLKLNNYRLPSINIKKKSYTCDINEIDDYIKNLIADGTISADDGFGNDISSGIYRDNSMQIKTAGNYNIPLTLKNAFADTANQTISVKVTGKLETYTVTLTTETVIIKKNSVFAPSRYIASATDRKGEDISEQIIYNSEVDLTTVGRYKVYYYIVGKDDDTAATLTVVVTD